MDTLYKTWDATPIKNHKGQGCKIQTFTHTHTNILYGPVHLNNYIIESGEN